MSVHVCCDECGAIATLQISRQTINPTTAEQECEHRHACDAHGWFILQGLWGGFVAAPIEAPCSSQLTALRLYPTPPHPADVARSANTP